jgi:hypothetical protein
LQRSKTNLREEFAPDEQIDKPENTPQVRYACGVLRLRGRPKVALHMFFRVVMFVWAIAPDLGAVIWMTDDEEDLETLLQQQQLRIFERRNQCGCQIPLWPKVPVAALASRLRQRASDGRENSRRV